jgi:quinohemoprotein amine dehydrogenase
MKTLLATILVIPMFAQSQTPQVAPSAEPAKSATEEGIPVTNPLVISKCGGCHAKDEHGNMLRISWERSTPEGWEEAIKRMVRLNGVRLTTAWATIRSMARCSASIWEEAPRRRLPRTCLVIPI